jgi:hypothetical protein
VSARVERRGRSRAGLKDELYEAAGVRQGCGSPAGALISDHGSVPRGVPCRREIVFLERRNNVQEARNIRLGIAVDLSAEGGQDSLAFVLRKVEDKARPIGIRRAEVPVAGQIGERIGRNWDRRRGRGAESPARPIKGLGKVRQRRERVETLLGTQDQVGERGEDVLLNSNCPRPNYNCPRSAGEAALRTPKEFGIAVSCEGVLRCSRSATRQ